METLVLIEFIVILGISWTALYLDHYYYKKYLDTSKLIIKKLECENNLMLNAIIKLKDELYKTHKHG